ncbi:hypothetical protein Dimus_035230 [Dionaea muscipula]
MAVLRIQAPPCLHTPHFRSPSLSFSARSSLFFPQSPLNSTRSRVTLLRVERGRPAAFCLPKAIELAILEAESNSDASTVPCVRTYENDLARITLVGPVDFQQALTAAAADGGVAADEHIASGVAAMVVETLFPGSSDPHSTVSTRLFLPARKVKEKSRKLRRHLPEDILSSTTPSNILAITFRQVVVQQLWSFELVLFKPGSQRNMEDLENPREVPTSFTVSSSDKGVISALAEVVCMFTLDSTRKQSFSESLTTVSDGFIHWFQKTRRISSKDSSATIYVFEDDILKNAKGLLQKFHNLKGNYQAQKRQSICWLTSSLHARLEKIGGSDFGRWTREFVPCYKLQIDAGRFSGVKFDGWVTDAQNRSEVLLTYSQMVALADILDLFLEDVYTMPDKQLSGVMLENITKLANKKLMHRGISFWGVLSTSLAGAVFLISLAVLRQLSTPHLWSDRQRHHGRYHLTTPLESSGLQPLSLESSELEAFCTAIIRKIKDSYGWGGDIRSEASIGVWIGELPEYFRNGQAVQCSFQEEPGILAADNGEVKQPSLDHIASYQVVLSLDGKIVGFQPTSGVAVNQWAINPLTRELYGGKKLSPGLFEPGLKICKPDGVVVLELLVSVNPDDYCFALARRPAL